MQLPNDFVQDIHIAALLILDTNGNRLFAQYYPDYSMKHKVAEEEKRIAEAQAALGLTSPQNKVVETSNTIQSSPTSSDSTTTTPSSVKARKPKKEKPPSRFDERQKLYPTIAEQQRIEQAITQRLSSRSSRGASPSIDQHDVMMFEQYLIVFSQQDNIRYMVFVKDTENEIIASCVLDAITKTLQMLFDNRITKDYLVQAVDLVFLLMDEVIDDGYIVELDPDVLLKRISMRSNDPDAVDGSLLNPISPNQNQDINLSHALSIAGGALLRAWKGQ